MLAVLLSSVSVLAAPRGAAPASPKFSLAAQDGIEDQFIVVLNEGASATAALTGATSLLAGRNAAVLHQYSRVLRGFAARMSAEDARALSADARVKYVVQDGVMAATTDQLNPPSWGLDRIDEHLLPLDQRYSYTEQGQGVNAYVVDSGIRTSHVDLAGRADTVYDAIQDGQLDCNGHGTHVAGTIGGAASGVAKQVQLHSVRVLGCDGKGSWANLIAAMDWLSDNAVMPAVVNMSLGGGFSQPVNDGLNALVASGIPVVVAAGNNGQDACDFSPSSADTAITVGSVDRTDTRAASSNFGACVDLFAPGVEIRSASNADDVGFTDKSGTSMASPHVAGMVARMLGRIPLSPGQVISSLTAAAAPWLITNAGAGSPNLIAIANVPLPPYPKLAGTVHISDVGDRLLENERWVGTKGAGTRIEALTVNVSPAISGLGVEYMCHVEGSGDQPYHAGGTLCGTTGQSRRLEGFAVRLTGALADRYDVLYKCNVAGLGDQGAMKNGAFCGTRGEQRRIESIWMTIAPKAESGIGGLVHLQGTGDQAITPGAVAGTRNQFLRLEGFAFDVTPALAGVSIEYLCTGPGGVDSAWLPAGAFCGTRGQGQLLEGFAARLTGANAKSFDLLYLCDAQDSNYPVLKSNGEYCGRRGAGKRLEALQIWIARTP